MGINACWLGDMLPRTVEELLYMILITLIQQYLIAYFLSETVTLVRNYTQTLTEFDNNLQVILVSLSLFNSILIVYLR